MKLTHIETGYLASYFVPICLLLFGGRDKLPPAPWRLSDGVAKICNVVSLVYIVLQSYLDCDALDANLPETGVHQRHVLHPQLLPGHNECVRLRFSMTISLLTSHHSEHELHIVRGRSLVSERGLI